MTVGQTIEAKIVVDAKQAQANVDAFNRSLSAVEQTAQNSGGRLEAMQKSAKSLQERMGPAAAAISSVSSALGATGGAAGQTIAVVGQLAAAFGAGGPMAVALVATTTAIDKLTKAWDEQIKKQDEALRKTYASAEAAAKSLAAARAALREAQRSGMPEDWRQSADAAQRLADVDKRIAEERARLLTKSGRQRAGVTDEQRAAIEGGIKILEGERQQVIALNEEIEKQARNRKIDAEQAEFDAKRREAEAKRLEAARAARVAYNATLNEERRIRAELQIDMMAQEEKQLREAAIGRREAAERQKAQEAAAASMAEDAVRDEIAERLKWDAIEEKLQDKRTKKAEEAAKERVRIAKEEAEAKAKAEQEFQSVVSAMTMNGVGIAVSATQQYIDARIKGEEAAEAAFAASIMAQAGQALISYGTQLGGKAIMDAFIAPPLAAAEGAAAAGLIAAGIGLGGAATAVQHTAGGGTVGKPMGDRSGATDRGAAPRTGGGGGSGGPLVVNVSYGVGGPLPEDTAREIAKVMKTGNRRRGAA